jgi:hypothetical protein
MCSLTLIQIRSVNRCVDTEHVLPRVRGGVDSESRTDHAADVHVGVDYDGKDEVEDEDEEEDEEDDGVGLGLCALQNEGVAR